MKLWTLLCCSLCVLIASATVAAASIEATSDGARSSGGGNEARGPSDRVAGDWDDVSREKEDCTDLARDEETLMVFSTLGGGLTAIDPITSEIRWTIADDPPIMAEQQQNVQVPQYLPDPRDGSIYQLGNMGDLKKLPYTIPQLVASAPCRSSDGILYSGKKSDTWFLVDPKSGHREKVMGFGEAVDSEGGGESGKNPNKEKIGWATSRSIYLGRTQYTVMMYDSMAKDKNTKPWNITFYDYNAHTMAPDISNEYEYIHLTTTSNGNIVTLDRKTGNFLWKKDLKSPVVSAFLFGTEGLLSVPFTTVSEEAFEAILEESQVGNVNTVRLFQSLYVGEHQHGLYAFPSLVDKNTPRISTDPPIKLLDGPHNAPNADQNIIYVNQLLQKNHNAIIFGHYELPTQDALDKRNLRITPSPTKASNNHDLATIHGMPDVISTTNTNGFGILGDAASNKHSADIGVQTDAQPPPLVELKIESNAFNRTKKIILANSSKISKFINDWFMEHPSGRVHQILILIVLAMVAMFWYMCSTMRELKNQSENGSKTYSSAPGSSKSSVSNGGSASTEELIDLGDGQICVGKITFNSNEVLGKGCEGTFVFKGTFEERFVAVKRLLPECFTFADREVALLRESDAHENVVRYFCTEQDRQFRYIAVELCAATLQDYTEGELSFDLRQQIVVWDVLRQAAAGLNHLHSLNIVHRDIKPQNVLLSLPDVNGAVRVMISDFGLCKKLNFGKTSFSRRSGVTGTDGWIAPEMMRGQRTTTSVDIFSLGCVYYYVLSGGHHVFGDALKRQANILSNEYNLTNMKVEGLNGESSRMILAVQLISDMINKDPQCRPPARCIGNHPIFWNNQKTLAFLQDVSDRVDKLKFNVEPLKTLEKNGSIVVLDDWDLRLDPLITEDLRKYRGYMGASVRDLLRALRNKKHHYHDLKPEAQMLLGSIPNEFTNYWLDKFPPLISHVYHALSICSNEPIFKPYYNSDFHFKRPDYFDADDSLFPVLLNSEFKKRDPKIMAKQTSAVAGGGSPKKLQRTPENTNTQKTMQLRGSYNFHKTYADDNGAGGAAVRSLGLQRNLESATLDEADEASTKRDVYASFKYRRNAKTSNRNNNNNNNNKDKSVAWTLPQQDND